MGEEARVRWILVEGVNLTLEGQMLEDAGAEVPPVLPMWYSSSTLGLLCRRECSEVRLSADESASEASFHVAIESGGSVAVVPQSAAPARA